MSSTVCQSHKFQFIEQNKLTPTESVGVISLLSAYQICLSVGATIGRPGASGERPCKIDANFLMRSCVSPAFFVDQISILFSNLMGSPSA